MQKNRKILKKNKKMKPETNTVTTTRLIKQKY